MNFEEKLNLIKKNTEEVLTEKDLRLILASGMSLKHYIGFEISGKIHLGTGLMCMSKVRDFMDAGIDCSIFLADWHTWINDKLGGDRETIKRVAVGYFKEGLKAAFKCMGGNPNRLKFVLGSDLYHNNDNYWATVIEVSKNISLARARRSITIMGREEGEAVDFAKLIYPSMQVADIFIQGINLAHAGMDQRKAHVIMRDCVLKLKVRPLQDQQGRKIKPVAIHHHLILGLQKPPIWPIPKDRLQEFWVAAKMSKSIPKSAVFITDEPDDIKKKVLSAFCPAGEVDFNPILDWAKFLIFTDKKVRLSIKRSQRFGGDVTFHTFSELKKAFQGGSLHPEDLKKAVAERVVDLLEPARNHFKKSKIKAMKQEMEKLIITR